MKRSGQLLVGPGRMALGEPAQGGSLGDQISFQEHESPSFQSQDGLILLLFYLVSDVLSFHRSLFALLRCGVDDAVMKSVIHTLPLEAASRFACWSTMDVNSRGHDVSNSYTPLQSAHGKPYLQMSTLHSLFQCFNFHGMDPTFRSLIDRFWGNWEGRVHQEGGLAIHQ